MNVIESKIEHFCQEANESVREIIEGSDEHLDMILSLINPLNEMALKFEVFNDFLIESLDNCSNDYLRDSILPKLKEINKISMTLIGAVRTSYWFKDVRNALRNFTKHHNNFREIIHDIQNIRLAKDDDFDNILKEINNM